MFGGVPTNLCKISDLELIPISTEQQENEWGGERVMIGVMHKLCQSIQGVSPRCRPAR